MAGKNDEFLRDLSFSGIPSEYRQFRRKILLSVASLESKQIRLAGPKILTRLSGEAWRATEHLSVGELRSENGWSKVLAALDSHYRFLPETELNESVDEFLFGLKRRPNEGPTAFISRFKAALSRLETLIAADKAAQKSDSKRRRRKPKAAATVPSTSSSESDISSMEAAGMTAENVQRASASAAAADKEATAGERPAAKTVGSFVGERSPTKGPGSAASRGTQKADDDKAQRKMMEDLELLEVGHLKLKPVFPAVVQGHLFMRKYGLSREQRSLVVRATGGSSKFEDVERIIRASDFEDRRPESSRDGRPAPRQPRREGIFAASTDSPSMSEPSLRSSGEEAMEADLETEDEDAQEEIMAAYEAQKKAKEGVKRHFKNYRDQRRKVREIRKTRQPYMPVVALAPDGQGTSAAAVAAGQPQMQPTFRYDRKGKPDGRKRDGTKPKREDVHLLQGQILTEFAYVVASEQTASESEVEILLASIPEGHAILDTGCTSSVVGERTADRLAKFLTSRGVQGPESLDLPPVQLRGFNGARTTSSKGLRWTICLGKLWGTVTTYLIPGEAPFLLSRKVLEGMEATLDLGAMTLTSEKHGMIRQPLAQAANGHMLLPLVPEVVPGHFQVAADQPEVLANSEEPAPGPIPAADADPEVLTANEAPNRLASRCPDKSLEVPLSEKSPPEPVKRSFQTIVKNTRYCQVDSVELRQQLQSLFGCAVDCAFCAYRPKFERIPSQSHTMTMYRSVARLDKHGVVTVSAWEERPPGKRRQPFDCGDTCIFAFRERPVPLRRQPTETQGVSCCDPSSAVEVAVATAEEQDTECASACAVPSGATQRPRMSEAYMSVCDCCAADAETDTECCEEEAHACFASPDLSTLYEEADWVSLEVNPLSSKTKSRIGHQVEAVRRTPFQLQLSALQSRPEDACTELKGWLKTQASVLDSPPGKVALIEVFAGSANLSRHCERIRQGPCIRIGLGWGQDLLRANDRRLLLLLIALVKPKDVWFSWPCRCWSGWSSSSINKGGSCASQVRACRSRESVFLRLFEQAWQLQTMQGGHAHGENPSGSHAWQQLSLGPAFEVDLHMCAVGLRHPQTRQPVLRPTRIVTTDASLAESLRVCRCPSHPDHAHLADQCRRQHLASWSDHYPMKFCKLVARTMHQRDELVEPCEDVLLNTDDEADSESEDFLRAPASIQAEAGSQAEQEELSAAAPRNRNKFRAMIQKLHVNTGHSSNEQMLRLAHRAKASEEVIQAIKEFRCSICEELQVPPSHRTTAMSHTETPNHIVGLDIVQVELKKETPNGVEETKFNVLTAVDYATDFAQQYVLPPGPRGVSRAFHELWCRPYGPPRIVYVDPDQRWISGDFQDFLRHNSITLLSAATESHWQLGRVEIAQRILRNMAKRVWHTTSRPAKEVIETCASVRNEHLRRHGFSSAQWFLGREPRVPASLSDLTERDNIATQDAVLSEPDFHAKMQCRQLAAHAFIEAHAHETWRKAIKGRNRPLRGPYVVGQSVYVFRRGARGLLSTRHGVWHGPGKIVGTEGYRRDSPIPRVLWVVINGLMYKCSPECGKIVGTEGYRRDSPIPRVLWVVINGLMYKCSPECLRPIVEDELAFKQLARQYHTGVLPDELEVPSRYMGPGGHYVDLTNAPPEPVDFDELCPSPEHEPPDLPDNPAPAVRRRITHGPEYWAHRAADSAEAQNQLGQLPSPRPEPVTRSLPELPQEGDRAKSRRLDEPSSLAGPPVADSIPIPDTDIESALEYSPSLPPDQEGDPSQEGDMNQSELADVEMPPAEAMCCEVSFDVTKDDIEDDVSCLWTALEECAEVKSKPAKKRRVEVAFRRLSPQDQERFRQAMSKEWQSWLENKVTSIVKAKGIDRSRIIGSRWVLTWKTSADPDNREVVPKARLVLVGYQDPDLGKIATDSPTLRKESKHIILSLCAAFGWTLWSADIKTAFLSGDASCRNIHFRPPPEIRELMGLSSDDLFRLEKAAYGLAEAPRAWFLRLSRELKGIGLTVSALDPCVFVLRNQENGLVGVCGVHVDDLIGGGGPEMDTCLAALRKKLPFGEFRTKTIKYTGAEIRQHEDFSIELSQEAYIEKMDFVQVPGKSTADLEDPGVMRACCGQLAWVASHSRPDQAFLSSYLQGVQDKAQCRHLTMYNKALREMKTQKVTLRFPRVPASDWRLLVITDAGWGVRESGESQGGLILCLCESKVLRQEEGICWVIEWASKKLRRVVRSSTAAETLAAQNGLDCIEFAQAFIQECLNGMSPREFRTWTPEETSGLVIDSKSLYDALTRSACSTALAIEKRLAIDSAIARASLQERNIVPFWTNNLQMVADPLTKLRGATDALYKLLATCRYRIRPCTQSGRKEKAQSLPKP